MMKLWAVTGVAALTAVVSAAQERAPVTPEMVVKMKAAAEQLSNVVRVPFEAKTIAGAPYSAEVVTESVETLADGNRIVHRTSGRVCRDGEGRVRREEDRGSGQAPMVSITDPVAKVSYSLDPDNKVALKTLGTEGTFFYAKSDANATFTLKSDRDPADIERKRQVEQEIAAARRAEESHLTVLTADAGMMMVKHGESRWDEKVEKLPAKQIEGVSAEGTRTTRTIPAGAIGNERPIVMVTEEWRSPDLQVLVSTTTSDPRTGETTYKLTNIVRGEPGASWFEVPAGYTVKEGGIRKSIVIKHEHPEER